MERDEILAKSRNENKKQDEYQSEVNKSSMRVGMLTVVAVCVILMTVEYFVYGECKSRIYCDNNSCKCRLESL